MFINLKELVLSFVYVLELSSLRNKSFPRSHIVRSVLLSAEICKHMHSEGSEGFDGLNDLNCLSSKYLPSSGLSGSSVHSEDLSAVYGALCSLFNHIDYDVGPDSDSAFGPLVNSRWKKLSGLCNYIDLHIQYCRPDSDLTVEYMTDIFDKHNMADGNEGLIELMTSLYNENSLLRLTNCQLTMVLCKSLSKSIADVCLDDMYQIISKLLGTLFKKSESTYLHSLLVFERTEQICGFYNFPEDKKQKVKLAAILHDIGKSAVPCSILEKEGSLSNDDRTIIRAHPVYTERTLKFIKPFSEISGWASNHHEFLDGSGYPKKLSSKDLDFESRLICCIDIYQALRENRSYRAGLSHGESINAMAEMVENHLIDENILSKLKDAFA